MRRCTLVLLACVPALPMLAYAQTGTWQMEPSETTADLRGVHAVGGGVVWASGTGGTVLRSQDSGFEWQQCATPPGAEKLDFRAIWAWDDQTAIVMSSGTGALSRLYKTTDGCAHWTLLFTNPEPNGFYDTLLFTDRQHGLVLGDPTKSDLPVEGRYLQFRIRMTLNGGQTWIPVYDPIPAPPGVGLNPLPREAFFAASNSSAVVNDGWLWIGTSHARVFRGDFGESEFRQAACAGIPDPTSLSCGTYWATMAVAQAPLAHMNASSGIFGLAFSGEHGIAVGGDYARQSVRFGTAAWTDDYGQHWTAPARLPGGYRSAVAWDAGLKIWIAVGPNGSDLSRDDGRTWQPIEHAPADIGSGGEWNALSLPWVVGPHGRIAKLNAAALGK